MSTLAHLIRMKENNEIDVSGNNLNGTYELVD
jgi:hypothetical protein